MRYFKNMKYKVLVSQGDDGKRAVLNNGIRLNYPYGLTYDEVLIVDPETPITREKYNI